MKKQYPILTFLIGIFLISGVVFSHIYDSASASTSTVAAVTREQLATTATVVATTGTGGTVAPITATPVPAVPVTPAAPANASGYANGTYSATYTYQTPESSEQIDVTLTIVNGKVTSSSLSNSGYARESVRYQRAFASAYTAQVVGKSIASLNLSHVSGASLTTEAFNAAVSQIRSDAAA